MSEKTSIQVSRETKERLTKLGIKGDTYDNIILRLLERQSKTNRAPKSRLKK